MFMLGALKSPPPTIGDALLPDLASWWELNETTGTRVDSHGTNDMTPGAAASYTTGKKGNAGLCTDSTSSFFYCTNPTGLNTGDNDWAVTLWVNMTNLTTALLDAIFSISDTSWSSNSDGGMHIGQRNDTDMFDLSIRVGSTRNNVNASTFGVPSTGTWYFIYAYHDASEKTIGISVNGGTIDTNTYTGTANTKTGNVSIGRMSSAGSVTYALDGAVDEVAFFNRTLTSEEVTWLYNSGAGRAYGDL